MARAATGWQAAVVAAAALALAGCGSAAHRPAPKRYAVRAGDTLYSIAFRHGLDYREVARANGIGSDYRIHVGQLLNLESRATPRAAPVPEQPPGTAPAVLPVTAAPRWQWPANGTSGATVKQPAGGLGLEIEGAGGADVRAAAAGKVVYSGAGLRGYGTLVILKHDEAWLTAYGYNRDVIVHEGEAVRAGQRIATMGEGPSHRPALYFEIRLNGRPVDPAGQLPSRR